MAMGIAVLIGSFHKTQTDPYINSHNELITDWYDVILDVETYSEGFRFPVVSRAYAYIGMAAYESVIDKISHDYVSIAHRFPGLQLSVCQDQNELITGLILNACYAQMIELMFPPLRVDVHLKLKSIESKWENIYSRNAPQKATIESINHGKSLAKAIYQWSTTDSLGHLSHHFNYDRNYLPTIGEGKWSPSKYLPMPAMLPYWGQVRPFIVITDSLLAKPLPEYSTDSSSIYFKQALEVYTLLTPLTTENMQIAEFWMDDHPGIVFSHPGHWIAIANQVIKNENPPLGKTLETYLKLGFALHDASVVCWNSKYKYNLIRPEVFIQKYINHTWKPHSPAPSHPSYPSGHSTFGGAAAEILTDLYGENYFLEDESHKRRVHFKIKPRKFQSFKQMAMENSMSRILLGVHFRMDCEEGRELGTKVGMKVNQLPLYKLDNKLLSFSRQYKPYK